MIMKTPTHEISSILGTGRRLLELVAPSRIFILRFLLFDRWNDEQLGGLFENLENAKSSENEHFFYKTSKMQDEYVW